MSFKKFVKKIVGADKYESEKQRCIRWKENEERRIRNSPCTKQLAQMIFANDNAPAIITVKDNYVSYSDGIYGHKPTDIYYNSLGFPSLSYRLEEWFVTYPDDYHWEDHASPEWVDQVLFLTYALRDCAEARYRYKEILDYDPRSYKLVRKDYRPVTW